MLMIGHQALAAVKWNNPSSDTASNKAEEINTYGGNGYISEKENPNFQTLRWSLYRKIHYRPISAERFHSIEGKKSYQFEKNLKVDNSIKKQMKISPLLSYLLYEDGKITVDEITPQDRFGDMFSNSTMYHSMSMGKSITSFLVGHSICNGTIEGINAKLDDWTALKGTLYDNQKLLNFLNMATGDKNYSNNDESSVSIRTRMLSEFQGTKKSAPIYNYTNLNTNIVITYLLHKYGEQGFKDFLDDVFINKVKIQNEIFLNKTSDATKYEKSLGHQFFATRYDYLRIAVAMLNEWQANTCVGKYLQTIHKNRIPKNGAQGKRGRVGLPLSYGGFFHTGYKGMENRPVMGMDGNGGQTILIDFERGRIVATLSVFDNMRFPKSGSFDFKKISHAKIKDGQPSLVTSLDISKQLTLDSDTLKKENRARREEAKKAKIFWDNYYDQIFFGNKAKGAVLLTENFEKKNNLSVQDYDKNWRIEKDNNGNSIYCNKIKDGWTEFNFGEKNWSDYSISYKLKFLSKNNGKAETHFRMTKQGRHISTLKQFGSKTMIEAMGKFFSTELSANDWLNIEVTVSGSEIKTYVNGEIATSSDNAVWERGSAMIAASKNSKLCVDDILVRKL